MNNINRSMPLVILTGHRKSGTSMFHRLFDGLNSVNLYPADIAILYAYFSCFVLIEGISNNELRARLLHVVRKSMNYILKQNSSVLNIENFMKIFKIEISNINLRDKTDVISSICNTWLKYQGVQVESMPFIFKETSQSIFFKDYLGRFPKLKMISLVRDPRDNYAAINAGVDQYYSKFGENSIDALSSLINRARMDLMSSKINQENYPESFMAIRFEDLVVDTEKVMRKVSDFLKIDFNPTMIVPEIHGSLYTGNNFEGRKFNGVSKQNIGAWKDRISVNSAKVIEYWMADVMEYWGYMPEFSHDDAQSEFSKFYEKYNCKYFYYDSYAD